MKAKTTGISDLSKAIQEEETLALKQGQSVREGVEVAKAVEAQEKAEARTRPMRPPPWREELDTPHDWRRCDRSRKFVVACILVLGARGCKPRRCEEIPPLFEHYSHDVEELELHGLFNKKN